MLELDEAVSRLPSVAHGGVLKIRYFPKDRVEADVPRIRITRREWCDLQLIGVGALSPLEGFMTKRNYLSCIREMRLEDGTIWSIPITLSVSEDLYADLKRTDEIGLEFDGKLWGVVEVEEIYAVDKGQEAVLVYGTDSLEHPSVFYLKSIGERYVGGRVKLFELCDFGFPEFFFTPQQTRLEFLSRGWKSVAGFQTRNAPHRGHEYVQKCALAVCDGLFINPIVGETKNDDTPADAVIRSYQILVSNYFRRDRVLLGVLPSAMRYGGPKEAVHHAIIRKNYGCTHFIVGRDHAGYKNFYGPYDAHKIFETVDVGLEILFFEDSFWCDRCGEVTSSKICPHDSFSRIYISGTKIRQMLLEGKIPPTEMMRRDVAEVLLNQHNLGSGRN